MAKRVLRTVAAIGLVFGGWVTVVACSLQEGVTCDSNRGECRGATKGLGCVDGIIRAVECRGAKGCKASGGAVTCDQSIANEGDTCLGANACSTDGRSFLQCQGGRFVRGAECPTGCKLRGDRAECETPEILPPLQ